MYRFVAWGVLLAIAPVSATQASIAYGLEQNGRVLRFDTSSSAPATVVIPGGYTFSASGLTIDGNGVGWSIDWLGGLRRLDLASGTISYAGSLLPSLGSFYKDLSYDPINKRVLALHTSGGTHRILAINTMTATYSVLGAISGLGPDGHLTALACGSAGELVVGDAGNRRVFDLVALPGGGGFVATPRSLQRINPVLEGLEYDHSNGDLVGGIPLHRFAADGTYQPLAIAGSFIDIAFVPTGVPSPSTAIVIGFAGSALLRRHRNK